jgi:hypothetical protein
MKSSQRRKSKSLKKRQPRTKIPTGNKTILKQILRDECLPALGSQSKYYSAETVKTWLNRRKLHCPPMTLNRYFHEFTRTGLVFAAGRGWYSTLATPFTLNREPVAGLVQELKKTFPLLDFSCWSTEQISGAMHHLLSRFVTFVHVETDARESVWQHLRDTGWDAWLNPRGTEATRFAVRERTVVVRSESRKSPSKTPVAPIEKLLVELCFEARDLQIMGLGEFQTMLANLAGTHRIPMAKLLSYAGARKLPLRQLFGESNQLIPPF